MRRDYVVLNHNDGNLDSEKGIAWRSTPRELGGDQHRHKTLVHAATDGLTKVQMKPASPRCRRAHA